jgi:hypothetical protein
MGVVILQLAEVGMSEERARIELDPEQQKETKEEAPQKESPETELTVNELEERIAPVVMN